MPFLFPGLLEALKNAIAALWDAIAKILSISISFNGLDLVKYLYGNSFGLSLNLPLYVFAFVFVFAIMVPRLRKNGISAAVILVGMPTFGLLWFFGMDQVQQVGDILKKVALGISYDNPSSPSNALTIQIPSINVADPVALGFVFILTIWVQVIMLSMMFGYEPLNVALTIIGILVLAASGMGERTRKFFAFIISVYAVSALFGVPVMIALIRIAKLIVGVLPSGDGTAVLASVIMWFIALVSIFLQFVIGGVAYRSAYSVIGNVIARVNNRMRSILQNKARLDVNLAGRPRSALTNRFDQLRVHAVNFGVDKLETFKRQKAASLSEKVKGLATKSITAVGMAAPHPVAKIGAPILAGIIDSLGNRPLPRARMRREHE